MFARRLRFRRRGRRVHSLRTALLIGAVALMSLTALNSAVQPAQATGPGPDCISPCHCTDEDVSFSNVVATATPTNVTIQWDTSYSYVAVVASFANSTGQYLSQNATSGASSIFIDFLEPGTHYSFELVATPTSQHECIAGAGTFWEPGSYYGSFTTGADHSTSISGFVTLAGGGNGGQTPYHTNVEVYCPDIPQGTGDNGWTVNSAGAYSIPIDLPSGCDGEPLIVTATSYAPPIGDESGWFGYWNETVLFWAPQVVDLVLSPNYDSSYMPTILDYSNVPGVSGYSLLSVTEGVTYDESYTYGWSAGAQIYGIGGGGSGSTTFTNSYGAAKTYYNNEGTLCYAVQYVVSGNVEFSAISRTWAFSQSLLAPFDGNYCNQLPGYQIPQDWMTNGSVGNEVYYLPGPAGSNWSSGLHNFPLRDGDGFAVGNTTTTTTTVTTGLNFGFTMTGVMLAGAPSVSASIQESWTQSISNSLTVGADITGPGQGSVSCYNVEGEGATSQANYAESISVFYWQGWTLPNGGDWCGPPPS